jgi:sulfite exporter TauE/SafE
MSNKIWVTLNFLAGKLVAYTVLGVVLGALGAAVALSPRFFGVMQVVAAVYMLGVAGAMLQIHPVFRYFLFQPPRWAGRMVRTQSKSKSKWGAVLLGLATVLIPCGTTQAMMALATVSGSAIWGGAIMATFVLGTVPVFLGAGAALGAVGGRWTKAGAYAVLLVGLYGLNGGLVVAGSPITAQKVMAKIECAISFCSGDVMGVDSTPGTEVTIEITKAGYRTSRSAIAAGEEIKLSLVNTDGRGCQQAFTIPSLGISKVVRVGEKAELAFRAPEKPGSLEFTCSMGMYSGKLNVI